ncbi:CHAT domain-containing protein [Boletus edulis BED1]|uniref:CHAT domain-containing protein n=1 Tax=Boletus edulis BED1 TaxID=1328754 RepID=A0AAD4BPM0_BOLED|nr:CHAT domain-containing protein [Boletus edulis BED1]
MYRAAMAARPVGHPDRPSTLVQLAAVHFARFDKQRDEVEADRGDALLREAMELSSTESHEKRVATFMLQLRGGSREGSVRDGQSLAEQELPSCSTDEDPWALVERLMERFSQFNDLADLQQAITALEDLIRSTPALDERYCTGPAKLGLALWYRFDHSGELSDLEKAISMSKDAVDLIPDGHPDKPNFISNLGNCLADRFERLGDLSDLEEAISTLKVVVDLTPHTHPDKPDHLNNLSNSFLARFERLGELSDINEAISMLRDAVKLTPHGRPDDPVLLGSLGSSLYLRFMRLGQLSDLEEAIPLQKGAVDLTPHGHPYKPGLLHNLGKFLKAHFERLGKLSYLEDAISTLRDAIKLTPCGHYGKPGRLDTLGSCLGTRFHQLGELSDLQDSIAMHKNAVDLTPRAHPERPNRLNNLGSTFYLSFTRFGEMDDLKDAISRQKQAVDLTPLGHPDKPGHINNLANSFLSRFERLGDLSDIEHAISMLRDAVNLTPVDHPLKATLLMNLGVIIFHRFIHLREPDVLEDAIISQRDAVDLTPDGHPNKPSILSHLGNSLITRFEYIGEPSDLEDAISKQRDAVNLTPHGHPAKPSYFNNLGNCLIHRFRRFGERSDLEEAVSMLRAAVDLTPFDHPHKSPHLRSLGQCLVARFRHVKESGDLDSAILMLREAADLVPHGHLQKPAHLYFLAASFKARFNHTGKTSDLEQAIILFSYAATVPIGPIGVRFSASRNWISCALCIRHHTLLHAYSVAISLFPQLAWMGLSLTQRYIHLAESPEAVVREAAAAALDSGLPETAVEWLEQGRSILWGDLFQLRSSYEELSSVHPDYATRFRELSVALGHASVTREKSSPTLPELVGRLTTELSQHEIDKHRMLASERYNLLLEIRRLPGFEQFLLHKAFAQLRCSAHSGPIVILNAAESRCDALILIENVDHVLHVPLPNFTLKRSTHLQNILKSFIRRARVMRYDRVGKVEKLDGVTWESILSPLWKCVVKPVLDALAISTPGDLTRIFWCPTGPFVFLPFHAAGFYGTQHSQAGHKVYDFVVSSYIPTIATLGPSPNLITAPTSDLRLLAVGQPSSDGQFRLPGVHTELEHIKDVIRNSPSTRTVFVESSTGTVEEVLGMMKESDWVHFACHGIQDADSPIDSGLCLADKRRLKLRDIIALSRPHGGLAFLSACQTAMGDKSLSDEALHIAAGMLFAGYKGVVGTMWSISDKLAPGVARDVYGQLFGSGTKPDYREAARALHDAIESLRDSGEASFDEWIPFIHVGL